MADLTYTLVIDDQNGVATIRKVEQAVKGMGTTVASSMTVAQEAAARANAALLSVGVNYKNLGAYGQSMHSQLARSLEAGMNKSALTQLQQAGLVAVDVTEKAKRGVQGMAQGVKAATEEATQFHRTLERLQRTALAFIGMWVLTKVLGIPKEAVAMAMEFNAALETAKLGIASILMAQGEFTNTISGSVQGYGKLIAAQKMSDELVKQLQLDNLRTIATFDQLVKAFQQTLAPGLERGFNVEQVREFTVAMVQAAGALGLNLDMLAEETRSLLRGTISPRQTLIATALGITNEDVRRFQGNAGALFDYLMGRLNAFTVAGVQSQKTWAGVMSNLKDAIKMALGAGFEDLFVFAKKEAQAFIDMIVVVDRETGKLTINPEIISAFKQLGYLIQAIYLTVKEWAGILSNLRTPVGILAELWRSISISANSYADALGRGGEKKLTGGVFGITQGVEAPKWLPKEYEGKSAFGMLLEGLKQFNDYISREGKYAVKEYMDYYQRQMEIGNQFLVRQKDLVGDQIEYLQKVAAETGYIDDRLKERVTLDLKSKGINLDIYSLSGEQLQVAIKTVEEHRKLAETGKEVDEAFKILLRTRLAIAAIGEQEAPLKIVAQIAKTLDMYELQKQTIIILNDLEKERLHLTGKLTPELEEQMDLRTRLSVKEIDWARELASIDRAKTLASMQESYAKMTGSIEGQLVAMKRVSDEEIRALQIKKESTRDEKKLRDLEKEIELRKKITKEEIDQAKITLPITLYKQPLAQAGMGWAEAKGSFAEYEVYARLGLENEIRLREAVTKEAGTYGDLVREELSLKRKLFDINLAIKKVEMETYASDRVAQAAVQYADMTGNLELQGKYSAILLENEIKRMSADQRIVSEGLLPQLENILRQTEALKRLNAVLEEQKRVLEWQRQLVEIQGTYEQLKTKEVELLEKERQILLANNRGNWEAVRAIEALYDRVINIANAQKNLDFSKLVMVGVQREAINLNKELAQIYEDFIPRAVNTTTDAFDNMFFNIITKTETAKDAMKGFVLEVLTGLEKMLVDMALVAVKAEVIGLIGKAGTLGKTAGYIPTTAASAGILGTVEEGVGVVKKVSEAAEVAEEGVAQTALTAALAAQNLEVVALTASYAALGVVKPTVASLTAEIGAMGILTAELAAQILEVDLLAASYLALASAKAAANVGGGAGGFTGAAMNLMTWLQKGGEVRGGSGVRDDVPIMATAGEYVIKKPSVKKYGIDFIEKVNRGEFSTAQVKGILGTTKEIKKMASGQVVGGSGAKDDVLIMATAGEYVVRKPSVGKYGMDFMEKINRGELSTTSVKRVLVTVGKAREMAGGGEVAPSSERRPMTWLQRTGVIGRSSVTGLGMIEPKVVVQLQEKKPTSGDTRRGDTYVTYIEATDVNSFARKYGGVIESIYTRGKRFNKVGMR